MRSRKRNLSFLALNVFVSLITTLVVLNLWVGRNFLPADDERSGGVNLAGQPEANGPESETRDGANFPGAVTSGQLEIRRIVGAGDLASERIEILHVGEKEVLLDGWSLIDEQGHQYFFPILKLAPQGSITVFTKSGVDIVVELYWGSTEPVWESGEVATLLDPSGIPQATYTVP